jgi:hypothetical protein
VVPKTPGQRTSPCADQYIASHRSSWKNLKHVDQWTNTIATCGPIVGKLPANEIDVALVRVLDPISATKAKAASRLRGWIESILD